MVLMLLLVCVCAFLSAATTTLSYFTFICDDRNIGKLIMQTPHMFCVPMNYPKIWASYQITITLPSLRKNVEAFWVCVWSRDWVLTGRRIFGNQSIRDLFFFSLRKHFGIIFPVSSFSSLKYWWRIATFNMHSYFRCACVCEREGVCACVRERECVGVELHNHLSPLFLFSFLSLFSSIVFSSLLPSNNLGPWKFCIWYSPYLFCHPATSSNSVSSPSQLLLLC